MVAQFNDAVGNDSLGKIETGLACRESADLNTVGQQPGAQIGTSAAPSTRWFISSHPPGHMIQSPVLDVLTRLWLAQVFLRAEDFRYATHAPDWA